MSQDIDKKAVENSFSKAAKHYDQFAQLQRDIGNELFNHIAIAPFSTMVDLGCGTGYFSGKLADKFPNATLTCFDLSNAMLAQVKKRDIKYAALQQGDIDQLPFKKNSLSLIYSNLVVQWSEDLNECLKSIKASLKKGGKCYISTLLNGTLEELTQAWKCVDKNPHTNTFLSLENIQTILHAHCFSQVAIKTETRTLYYPNVIEIMRALKGIGANHVHGHQSSSLSGKKLLKALDTGYQPFKNKDGQYQLTYQVCYIEVIK